LPQNPHCPKGISTFDYLSSVFFKNNWRWFLNYDEKEKIDNALKKIELFDKKYTDIDNLSAGEFQKANMALGLLSEADLFLLDEPCANLDLINRVKILDMIKSLKNSGITSIIILHDLNLAAHYGDYFAGIEKRSENKGGRIISGKKEEFFNNETLKKIYGIDFKIIKTDEKFYIQINN